MLFAWLLPLASAAQSPRLQRALAAFHLRCSSLRERAGKKIKNPRTVSEIAAPGTPARYKRAVVCQPQARRQEAGGAWSSPPNHFRALRHKSGNIAILSSTLCHSYDKSQSPVQAACIFSSSHTQDKSYCLPAPVCRNTCNALTQPSGLPPQDTSERHNFRRTPDKRIIHNYTLDRSWFLSILIVPFRCTKYRW